MKAFIYRAEFEPGDRKGIVVSFPDVPEAITQGRDMADARAMELPLVSAEGGGGDAAVGHDWHNLFARFGLLNYDESIGWITRGLGDGAMLVALLAGAWLLLEMARTPLRA